MSKKLLKINSWILILIGTVLIICSTGNMIISISDPYTSDDWELLNKAIIIFIAMFAYLFSLPLLITGIGTLKFFKARKTYGLCMFFSVIGIIIYLLFIHIFIYADVLNYFVDFYNGNVNTEYKIICALIVFLLSVFPLSVNLLLLYKEKNNLMYKDIWYRFQIVFIAIIAILFFLLFHQLYKLSITNNNKIKVTQDNIYSYYDFKSELEDRGLIYELPNNKKELTGEHEIAALDSSSKYLYHFRENPDPGSYELNVNTDRKFPLFIYNYYTSLVKKSNITEKYYNIGPQDWYVNWNIYFVNGNIYAAVSEESKLGSGSHISLSTTDYGIVVSEEKDITIYNSKNNYFVKKGGILDTRSGIQRSNLPTTTDIYNDKCMKIRVVDKVNAEVLDKIAKELVQHK